MSLRVLVPLEAVSILHLAYTTLINQFIELHSSQSPKQLGLSSAEFLRCRQSFSELPRKAEPFSLPGASVRRRYLHHAHWPDSLTRALFRSTGSSRPRKQASHTRCLYWVFLSCRTELTQSVGL